MFEQDSANLGLNATPVTVLKGVGPRNAARLSKLGITTVQDILFHLPQRYQDRTRVTSIGRLIVGSEAVIEAEVQYTEVKIGRRRSLLVLVSDGTGNLILRFFHFSRAQREGLNPGTRLRCFGEVRQGPASLEIIHPEYRRVGSEGASTFTDDSLTPIYPSTEGIHQLGWRSMIDNALQLLQQQESLPDWMPEDLLTRLRLPRLVDCVRFLHRPPTDAPLPQLAQGSHPAQERLAFEELVAHQLSLRRLRHEQKKHAAPVLRPTGTLGRRLLDDLTFKLTQAQQRVSAEIAADLRQPHPMLRLVQGDVGSGKTIIAVLAALQAVEAGYQVALMAPTELLAEQHLQSVANWVASLGVVPRCLVGRQKGKIRRELLASIASGSVEIVVGTHALFQEDVVFDKLGLVIIDEQHRFGVHQRMLLKQKGAREGQIPHQLIMTATPIPRTLAMSAYADLDLSVIDELPSGRIPVKTAVVSDTRREEVMQRVRNACAQGRQAYWVCTLIEESEAMQCQAAENTAAQLVAVLPDLCIGLVHGRMSPKEKEQTMSAFKAGEVDLLVATTVIEVGMDVPNASLMIIENPERLGLAQLHQLRGRVGRGANESFCVLMFHAPLSESARRRLSAMRDTNDGFAIARKDLELRGPGEVLGTRQTGEMAFRIADVVRDQDKLEDVRVAADFLLSRYPTHVEPLIRRWLGRRTHYGSV